MISLISLKNHSINIKIFDKFTFITIVAIGYNLKKTTQCLLMPLVSYPDKNAQLLIIGEGELRPTLERQIKTLDLQDSVFLLGTKSNPYAYLAKSDAFVFSSNHEGFPNVILEALACGLAIVSTDCQSGPREILGNAQSSSNQKMKH